MRDQRIDFIKGMLIWCVVYGHTINALLNGVPHAPVSLHTFVRTFDMPFFMILSGYFLRKSLLRRGAWQVFVNRISMILVPIVIWTLLLLRTNFWERYYFLWAVLVSGVVSIGCNKVSTMIFRRGWESGSRSFEFVLYLITIALFHIVEVPWNLFYLFPFFVFGYYMRDALFSLSKRCYCIAVVLFIVALCFWTPAYTPWNMGALAWRGGVTQVLICGYRFVLGIIGVYVMAEAFNAMRRLLGVNSLFVQTVARWGRETLALYILQSVFVEYVATIACDAVYKHYAVDLSQALVNLIGYVVAPILSFLATSGVFFVVCTIKSMSFVNKVFGYKVK